MGPASHPPVKVAPRPLRNAITTSLEGLSPGSTARRNARFVPLEGPWLANTPDQGSSGLTPGGPTFQLLRRRADRDLMGNAPLFSTETRKFSAESPPPPLITTQEARHAALGRPAPPWLSMNLPSSVLLAMDDWSAPRKAMDRHPLAGRKPIRTRSWGLTLRTWRNSPPQGGVRSSGDVTRTSGDVTRTSGDVTATFGDKMSPNCDNSTSFDAQVFLVPKGFPKFF